ncbi:hypothetical protein AB0C65_38260 [Nocardia sp. NPDC048505]|uniref:hypothetical protein n=1 Tax=Nocardia sp. NPDC048505 TaxID=3155756 RepID=UPI003411AE78
MSTTPETAPADALDDPYIARYAGLVADDKEVLMRADFARMRDLGKAAADAESIEQLERLSSQASAISDLWKDRDDELGHAWQHLGDAYHDWRLNPSTMARFAEQVEVDRAQGVYAMTDMQWRSHMQAREITGHGQWSAEADHSSAGSALAGHGGNAFAAGTERDGAER